MKNKSLRLTKKIKKPKIYMKKFSNDFQKKAELNALDSLYTGESSENPPILAYHIETLEDIENAGYLRWIYEYEKPSDYKDGEIFQPKYKNGSRFMISVKDPNDNQEFHSIYIFPYAEGSSDPNTPPENYVYFASEGVIPIWKNPGYEEIEGHYEIPLFEEGSDPNNPVLIDNPLLTRRLLVGVDVGYTITYPEELKILHDLVEYARFSKSYLNNDPNRGYYDAANDYNLDGVVNNIDLKLFKDGWLVEEPNSVSR